MDPRVANRQIYTAGYAFAWGHIPWDRLAKRGKAIRRNCMPMFPWDQVGVPEIPMPDPWEPVTDEEAQP